MRRRRKHRLRGRAAGAHADFQEPYLVGAHEFDCRAILGLKETSFVNPMRGPFARVPKDSGARQKIGRGENCLFAIEV